jgi:hypothetical protein
VAELMAAELNRDDAWKSQQVQAFEGIARHYVLS